MCQSQKKRGKRGCRDTATSCSMPIGNLMDFDDAEHQGIQRTFQEHGLLCTESIYHCYQQINSGLWKEFEQDQITQTTAVEQPLRLSCLNS